jgi:hypothetical protein
MNDEKQAGRQGCQSIFYRKTQYKGEKSTDVAWDLGLLYGPTPKDHCRLPSYLFLTLCGIIPEQSNSSTVQQPYETSKTKQ